MFIKRGLTVLSKIDQKYRIILTGDSNAKARNDSTEWKSVMGRYGYERRTWTTPARIHRGAYSLHMQHEISTETKSEMEFSKNGIARSSTVEHSKAQTSLGHSLALCNIKLRLMKMNNRTQQSCRVEGNQLRDEKVRQSHNTILAKNMEDIEPTCNLAEHTTRVTEQSEV